MDEMDDPNVPNALTTQILLDTPRLLV
jgi:hypothetical protein